MLKYKLTDQDNRTMNDTVWGENVTHTASGEGRLCGPGWLHYYHHPLLAVIFNPIHAGIDHPKLWHCDADGQHKDDYGLKGGCTRLTTLREIPLPTFTSEQLIEFAIRCAKAATPASEVVWHEWADGWLSGEDRSTAAAAAAAATPFAHLPAPVVMMTPSAIFAARAVLANTSATNTINAVACSAYSHTPPDLVVVAERVCGKTT